MPVPRGFTIIELLITVALVGILASVAVPMAELSQQRAREHELKEVLRTLRGALDEYKKASDAGHIVKGVGASGYPARLEDLLGVADARDPNGATIRLLRRIPRDPLNPDQAVAPARSWGLRSYASTAEQPRPGRDVFDIYSLAPGKGINGVPYKEW